MIGIYNPIYVFYNINKYYTSMKPKIETQTIPLGGLAQLFD